MAIETRSKNTRLGAQAVAGDSMASEWSAKREPGCCEANDHHHSLILTQLDGASEGFPLTWLYRWQWRKESAREVLTLTLTEHEITIHGKNLEDIAEHLAANRGLHLRINDGRYQSFQPNHLPQILTITVQPSAKSQPPPN